MGRLSLQLRVTDDTEVRRMQHVCRAVESFAAPIAAPSVASA